MRVVAFVPLKLQSVRLPGKAQKKLGPDPLYLYLLNTLKQVRGCDDIYVFCSDRTIASSLPEGIKFLSRDPALDANETLGQEIYESFISQIESDIYLLAHVTSPFILSETIDSAISYVRNGYDSAFPVRKIQNFIWFQSKPLNYQLDAIPRTQDLTPVYEECSAFFCFRSEVWKQEKRRIGRNPKMIEVSLRESVDIDTFEDFLLAEALL